MAWKLPSFYCFTGTVLQTLDTIKGIPDNSKCKGQANRPATQIKPEHGMTISRSTTSYTNDEINAILGRCAEQDFRLVRKEGEIAVTGTKEGCVWVSYDRDDKSYRITKHCIDIYPPMIQVLAEGKKAKVKQSLMDLYVVHFDR